MPGAINDSCHHSHRVRLVLTLDASSSLPFLPPVQIRHCPKHDKPRNSAPACCPVEAPVPTRIRPAASSRQIPPPPVVPSRPQSRPAPAWRPLHASTEKRAISNLLDRGCRGGAHIGGRVSQALLQRVEGDARFGGLDLIDRVCRMQAEKRSRVFESESETRDMRLAGIQKGLCRVVAGTLARSFECGDERRANFANPISRLRNGLARHRFVINGEMRENRLGAFADCGILVS